jgi:hypothetical protein
MNSRELTMSAPRIVDCFEDSRLDREWRTVVAMIRIYCGGRHGRSTDLCRDCEELRVYARARLQRCVFGGGKPTCANCPVHCYQPARREQMKQVMRYAGPRMLLHHPILTVRHWIDGMAGVKEAPGKAKGRQQ